MHAEEANSLQDPHLTGAIQLIWFAYERLSMSVDVQEEGCLPNVEVGSCPLAEFRDKQKQHGFRTLTS